jgi:predicted GNAT family acetyltransferase
MQPNLEDVTVIHNEKEHRFEASVDGQLALITYRLFPGKLYLDHTEVPESLEGHGLAAKLTRTALDFARAHHLRVAPLCPYASAYMRKHKESWDLLTTQDRMQVWSQNADPAK